MQCHNVSFLKQNVTRLYIIIIIIYNYFYNIKVKNTYNKNNQIIGGILWY